jgi:hypothetical protein
MYFMQNAYNLFILLICASPRDGVGGVNDRFPVVGIPAGYSSQNGGKEQLN